MQLIFAMAVWLVAFAVGCVSFAFTPAVAARGAGGEAKVSPSREDSAPPGPIPFKRFGAKAVGVLCAASGVCAVCAFLLLWRGVSVLDACRYAFGSVLLLSAAVTDSKIHKIPNAAVLIALGVGVALLGCEWIWRRETALSALISRFIGLIFCFAVFYLLARLTKGGVGPGDVKLLAALGLLLGVFETLIATLLGLLLCALTGAVLMLVRRKKKADRIPFAPFLFAGYTGMLLLYSVFSG